MNIVIVTTKDYHLFAKSNNWVEKKCELFKEYLCGLLSSNPSNRIAIEDFYGKEPRMVEFWSPLDEDIPELKFLTREFDHNTIVFVIPSIPIYHIESKRDGALQMSVQQCQDYVAAIVKSVIDELKTDFNNNNIIIIAHDRDLGMKATRVMRERDIAARSELAQLISSKQLKINNILGFQHEKDQAAYQLLSSIIDGETNLNLYKDISMILKESNEKQEMSELI